MKPGVPSIRAEMEKGPPAPPQSQSQVPDPMTMVDRSSGDNHTLHLLKRH